MKDTLLYVCVHTACMFIYARVCVLVTGIFFLLDMSVWHLANMTVSPCIFQALHTSVVSEDIERNIGNIEALKRTWR